MDSALLCMDDLTGANGFIGVRIGVAAMRCAEGCEDSASEKLLLVVNGVTAWVCEQHTL